MRTLLAVALAVALAALTACPESAVPPEPLVALDIVPGPGQVSCGPVTKDSELIGGPQAYAVVGRAFRCNNAKIRFIIQDASRPVGNSVHGGNLIDVDLQRGAPGERGLPGEDTFREHVTAIAAKEINVDKIEVVSAGGNGKDGVIRVTGTPTDLTLAPQAYYLSTQITGTLSTDYILHPDLDYIEIATTFTNDGPQLPAVQPADFVAFGGTTVPHTEEHGFGDVALFSDVKFLSSTRGEKVSYALVSPDTDIVVPFIDQGITAPFYGASVPVGSERTFVRYFLVGDGALESTTRRAYELKGLAHGTVTGFVKGADGLPLAGVLVSALDRGLLEDRARVINEARTNGAGAFTLTLAPGDYRLLAHVTGRARSEEVPVTIVDGGATAAPALTVGATGHVSVSTTFTDRSGADLGPLPSKLTLLPLETRLRPTDVLKEFEQNGASAYVVSNDGTFDADVPPGQYRAYVTRGFEFTRYEHDIDVRAGGVVRLAASIAHVVDTTGLVGGEFHQHCLGSIDAQVPIARKVLENAAEGIELASSTDHDVVTDFRPHVEALRLKPYLFVIAGNEVSYQGIGHFNAYPWNLDDADPLKDNGSRMWWYKTAPEMFADIRAAAGDPIIQINHPRAQLTGFFASMTLNPVDATRIPRPPPAIPTFPATIYDAWPSDFDAMEVNGNVGETRLFTADGQAELAGLASQRATDVPVLADYFALLGAGMKIVAMGNSDTHHLDEGVGYPRNFLTVGKDDPAALTEDDVRRTIRAQQNAVGQGCLAELFVDGARKQGIAEMISAASTLDVRVKLQAPPHVTPGFIEIYANGIARPITVDASTITIDPAGGVSVNVADAHPIDDVLRVEHALAGLPTDEGDLVVVALSKGGQGLAPTGGGTVFCYSAPLYVDVDGDGQFTPWLAGTQQVLAR